jgi:hypothetical protein
MYTPDAYMYEPSVIEAAWLVRRDSPVSGIGGSGHLPAADPAAKVMTPTKGARAVNPVMRAYVTVRLMRWVWGGLSAVIDQERLRGWLVRPPTLIVERLS